MQPFENAGRAVTGRLSSGCCAVLEVISKTGYFFNTAEHPGVRDLLRVTGSIPCSVTD